MNDNHFNVTLIVKSTYQDINKPGEVVIKPNGGVLFKMNNAPPFGLIITQYYLTYSNRSRLAPSTIVKLGW